jgi:hypothetical protein
MILSVPEVYTNALATSSQLNCSPSRRDSIPKSLELRQRFLGANLITEAGILLAVDQLTISRAIVLFQRFFTVSSLRIYSIRQISGASLLLSSKLPSGNPVKPVHICHVLNYIIDRPYLLADTRHQGKHVDYPPNAEGIMSQAQELAEGEMEILAALSFDTKVVLPYSLAMSYLQVLGLGSNDRMCGLTWTLVNDAIRCCPYLMITHQPNVVAVGCIVVAAAQLNLVVSEQDGWWEIFDVDSEDMGHCMVVVLDGMAHDRAFAAEPDPEVQFEVVT